MDAARSPYETTWEDWLLAGPTASFADPTQPLEVEIGPGEDAFLLEQAVAQPDRNWFGLEYSRKRVARYVRRIEREAPGIGNLRLIWRPAGDLVGAFLTPAMVAAYHIHFPDPWPKAHHGRYRLLTPAFLAEVAESLVDRGTLHVATDHPEYVQEVLEAAETVPALENARGPSAFATRAEGERTTVFEQRWREMGRTIHALTFRRRAR